MNKITCWRNLTELVKKHTHDISLHHEKVQPDPSGYHAAFFESISCVPEEIWNKTKNRFLHTDYFRAVEESPVDGMKLRYALLYENDIPISLCCFQIIPLSMNLKDPVQPKAPHSKNPLKKTGRKIKEQLSTRMLIAGSILLSGEYSCTPLVQVDKKRIYRAIAEIAERIAGWEKPDGSIALILIKDFPENDATASVFLEYGYHEFSAGPVMMFPIKKSWNSFEDYVSEMRGKYRKRTESVHKKGSSLIRKELSYEEIIQNQDRIYELYLQVLNRAKFKLFTLHLGLFASLKKHLKNDFRLDAYYAENTMVGFVTRLYNRNFSEGYALGIDYSENRKYDIYQNILYDSVRDGINRKLPQVFCGRTAQEMKTAAGAQALESKCFLKIRGKLRNSVLKPVFHFIKPPVSESRNPFK